MEKIVMLIIEAWKPLYKNFMVNVGINHTYKDGE